VSVTIPLGGRDLPADCLIFKHSTTCPISAQAAREVAARAENLLDEYTPNPDGAGPTWEAVLAAHMALDTATRVALQAADQAAKLA